MTDCKNEGNGRLPIDIFLIVIVEGVAAGKVRVFKSKPLIVLRGDDFSSRLRTRLNDLLG